VIIRAERDDDTLAIKTILVAAFAGDAEADLVVRLRSDNDLALALVAEDDGVLGYVAFPKLTVDDDDRTHDAAGLAPIAVMPGQQKQGIGGALIREGHRLLAARFPVVFVLGDPGYYARFGYSVAVAAAFKSAYAGPCFMALRLNETAPRRGQVRYPPAFDGLG
jgi:putative acetyltransferase